MFVIANDLLIESDLKLLPSTLCATLFPTGTVAHKRGRKSLPHGNAKARPKPLLRT